MPKSGLRNLDAKELGSSADLQERRKLINSTSNLAIKPLVIDSLSHSNENRQVKIGLKNAGIA
jgi:hypothetical protein